MKNIYVGLAGLAGDPELKLEDLSDWELFVVLRQRAAYLRLRELQRVRYCDRCDYSTAHRSAFSMHLRTHAPIPAGECCANGCGLPATQATAQGRFICSPHAKQCPVLRAEQAERMRVRRAKPPAKERSDHNNLALAVLPDAGDSP